MFVRSLTKNRGLVLLAVPHATAHHRGFLHNGPLLTKFKLARFSATAAARFRYVLEKNENLITWRTLASSSSNREASKQPGQSPHPPPPPPTTKPPQAPPPPPPPPIQASKETRLDKITPLSSQLADKKIDSSISKLPMRPIDITSKKFGWLVSGTMIAFLSAFMGKMYMLFGAVPLFLYHFKDMDVMSKTFSRDTTFLWRYWKCWVLAKKIKNNDLTLSKIFQQTEKRHPDRIMLQMLDQNWKFKDVASYANRTSRLMQKYGFQKGDVIAMFALNSPEMVAIVLGLANIGIITTLVSTELRSEGLTQAIKNCGCKGIIFDDELMHAFGDVYKNFDGTKIFQMRHKAKQPEFRVLEEELLREYNDHPEVFINVHYNDPLLYMYAPEDTVFKQPIVITHEKFLFDSSATTIMLDIKSSEKIYNPTPLHEPTGFILGIGPSITEGVPTVLRSKFSAVDYFRECYVYSCTVGQYAGTMCKHLLLSPVSPIETFHSVRVMYGSGLESDYWQEFVDRFGTKMYEVHDASPENINLINLEGRVGVIGFRPKLAPSFLFPHYVIKVFGKDNIPVRSSNGFCQLCDYGEPGMLIKLWTGSGNLPPRVKTLQNIFKSGDMAITTGEILTIDENLYLRPLKKHMDKSWMNKLVTSEEVEFIASRFTCKRCAAYSLPMGYKQDIEILAIEDPNKTLDMKKFTDDLIDHLPRNWVPHYVRIVSKFEELENKKVDKNRLIKQGQNMEGDLVHYFDKNSMCYKPLMWSNTNRPQVIVNEAKIQPFIEPGIKRDVKASENKQTCTPVQKSVESPKNIPVNTLGASVIKPADKLAKELEKKPIEKNNMIVNKMSTVRKGALDLAKKAPYEDVDLEKISVVSKKLNFEKKPSKKKEVELEDKTEEKKIDEKEKAGFTKPMMSIIIDTTKSSENKVCNMETKGEREIPEMKSQQNKVFQAATKTLDGKLAETKPAQDQAIGNKVADVPKPSIEVELLNFQKKPKIQETLEIKNEPDKRQQTPLAKMKSTTIILELSPNAKASDLKEEKMQQINDVKYETAPVVTEKKPVTHYTKVEEVPKVLKEEKATPVASETKTVPLKLSTIKELKIAEKREIKIEAKPLDKAEAIVQSKIETKTQDKFHAKPEVKVPGETKVKAENRSDVKASGITQVASKPEKTPEVEKKTQTRPRTKQSISDIISRKFQDFAEPVMTKLMKDRLAAKIEKAEKISPTPPLSKPVNDPTNKPTPPKEVPLHKTDLSAVEKKTEMLIKNVMQLKEDAMSLKSKMSQKIDKKTKPESTKKGEAIEAKDAKPVEKRKSEASIGFSSSKVIENVKSSTAVGSSESQTGEKDASKGPDSTKK